MIHARCRQPTASKPTRSTPERDAARDRDACIGALAKLGAELDLAMELEEGPRYLQHVRGGRSAVVEALRAGDRRLAARMKQALDEAS